MKSCFAMVALTLFSTTSPSVHWHGVAELPHILAPASLKHILIREGLKTA